MTDNKFDKLITKNSDREIFTKIGDTLEKVYGAKIVKRLGSLDFDDTMYWDFKYKDMVFTLHLEHILGIYIIPFEEGEPSPEWLRVCEKLVKDLQACYA